MPDYQPTKLTEGKTYPFKITGSIVSPDGLEYFKLSDINNVKHLLRKDYYTKYNLEVGQTINCKIDKINCSGKIFLEPLHPYYESGNFYEITYLKLKKIINSAGETEKIVLFTDSFENKIKVPFEDLPRKLIAGEKLDCRVVKIKKGRLLISINDDIDDFSELKAGIKYSFKISHIKTYAGKYEYYVLTDSNGKKYKLRKKFYVKYGLKPGQNIICRLISSGKKKYLEPFHPFYKIGKEYLFEIAGKGSRDVYPDLKKEVIFLKNDYGKEISLLENDISPGKIQNKKIRCKVTDIRRSEVFLDCS